MMPHLSYSVYMLCLFFKNYDDDMSTISPNPYVSLYDLGLVLLFFFNLRVFIKEQEEQESMRSRDTKLAAMKLPNCLLGQGGESGVGWALTET